MMKHIILCADDYGQNPAISQGILALLQKKRLSAVSCMVNMPDWQVFAGQLRPWQQQADLGMHFNLTEGVPLSLEFQRTYGRDFFALPSLILRAFSRRLDKRVLVAECRAQLAAFVAGLGKLPDFIDGHQHVHQLPQVREALLEVYEQQLQATRPYIRCAHPKPEFAYSGLALKKRVIAWCGAAGLQRLLQQKSIPHNTTFSGVYAFSQVSHYPQLFPQFLRESAEKGLIMCHPGWQAREQGNDVIAQARYVEYQYFSSEQYLQDCEKQGVTIGRF